MQDGRVALITGANKGVGLQIAKDLAQHDATVVAGSRDFEKGEMAAKSVGRDAHAIQIDVTDHASIAAAAVRIRFGSLSYVWFITLCDGQVKHFRDYMNPLQLAML